MASPRFGFSASSPALPPHPSQESLSTSHGFGSLHPPPSQPAMLGFCFSAPPVQPTAPLGRITSHPQANLSSPRGTVPLHPSGSSIFFGSEFVADLSRESNLSTGSIYWQNLDLQGKSFTEEEEVDVEKLVLDLKKFAAETEQTLNKVMDLLHFEAPVSAPPLASCPFNPNHRMPPHAAFRHSLLCSSSPLGLTKDDIGVLSYLRYPSTADCSIKDADKISNSFCTGDSTGSMPGSRDTGQDGADATVSSTTQKLRFLNFGEFDLTGETFSYKDAPAVVQSSAFRSNSHLSASFPPCIRTEFQPTLDASPSFSTLKGNGSLLYPKETLRFSTSKLWFLLEEVDAWQSLPAHYSPVVSEAAMGLGFVDRDILCQKLIASSSLYEFPLDSPLACHIFTLVNLCLLAISKEAGNYLRRQEKTSCTVSEECQTKNCRDNCCVQNGVVADLSCKDSGLYNGADFNSIDSHVEVNKLMLSGGKVREFYQTAQLPCPVLLECGDWLASCLTEIYQPVQAKVIVLEMFRQSLICAGNILSSSFSGPSEQEEWRVGHQLEGTSVGESHMHEGSKSMQKCPVVDIDTYTDRKGMADLGQVEAALDALNERSYLKEFLKAKVPLTKLTKDQLLRDYDAIVMIAEQERLRRPNLRAVLEHDGLMPNRRGYQDMRKSKTAEELLAEERDYKRRRMSYRGKKIRRTPIQVLHDIIQSHMAEIVAAGGIGCFGKLDNELSETKRSSHEQWLVESSEREMYNTSSQKSRNYYSLSHKDTPRSSFEDRESLARSEAGDSTHRLHRFNKDKRPP